jgi:hypothetical protein
MMKILWSKWNLSNIIIMLIILIAVIVCKFSEERIATEGEEQFANTKIANDTLTKYFQKKYCTLMSADVDSTNIIVYDLKENKRLYVGKVFLTHDVLSRKSDFSKFASKSLNTIILINSKQPFDLDIEYYYGINSNNITVSEKLSFVPN